MKLLINLLASTLAVYISAYIVPGIHLDFVTAGVTAIVLGALNMFVKPIIVFLTLPINILTIGLFTLVINTALVVVASYIVPGFVISSFLSAFLFSVVLSVVNSFMNVLKK